MASPKVLRIRHLIPISPLCIVAFPLDLLLGLEREALPTGEYFHGLAVLSLLTMIEIDATDRSFRFKNQVTFHLLAGESKDRTVDVRVHFVVLKVLPGFVGEEADNVPH